MIGTQVYPPNRSGQRKENIVKLIIKTTLEKKGYLVTEQKHITNLRRPPIFSSSRKRKNYLRADVWFEGLPVAPNGINISVKSLSVGGTVDQKLYYEVKHIIQQVCPCPTILVLSGPGWESKARERARIWVKSEVDDDNLLAVFFYLDHLEQWLNALPKCTGFIDKETINATN